MQADQQAKLQRKQELDRCLAALSNSSGSKHIAVNASAANLLATCRAATDKRIELDRQKRDAIEKLKKQELDAEKGQVAAWQSSIIQQGTFIPDSVSSYCLQDMLR